MDGQGDVEQRTESPAAGRAPAGVEIREAHGGDLPALLAIYNHWVRVSAATFDIEPLTDEAWRAWFDTHRDAGRTVLVAEVAAPVGRGSGSNELLGGAWLSGWRPRPGFARTAESSIYLHAAARGRGVGRTLYGALIARAREQGMHTLVSVITPPNPASTALHAALGYERVGVTREVGWKFERWQDSEIWQLMLDDGGSSGRRPARTPRAGRPRPS